MAKKLRKDKRKELWASIGRGLIFAVVILYLLYTALQLFVLGQRSL